MTGIREVTGCSEEGHWPIACRAGWDICVGARGASIGAECSAPPAMRMRRAREDSSMARGGAPPLPPSLGAAEQLLLASAQPPPAAPPPRTSPPALVAPRPQTL